MGFRLRDGLSFAICDEAVVFLDIEANRYFQLGIDIAEPFRALVEGTSDHLSASDRNRLEATGLLIFDEARDMPNGAVELRAATHLAIDPRNAPMSGASIRAAAAKAGMIMHLRGCGFAATVAALSARKNRLVASSDSDRTEVLRIAAAFSASRQILSDVERCLPSSMALAETFWKANIPVALVLGVRLAPFRAHSWVQLKDEVLNDHIDHIRSFTPILIL